MPAMHSFHHYQASLSRGSSSTPPTTGFIPRMLDAQWNQCGGICLVYSTRRWRHTNMCEIEGRYHAVKDTSYIIQVVIFIGIQCGRILAQDVR